MTVVLPDRPTATELAFASTLTNALATTNVAVLGLLAHCESDEPWAAEYFFRNLVKHPCDEIRIERADSPGATQYTNLLTGARANLPVQWLVVLRQPPFPFEIGGTNTTVLPAALFDGKIVITRRMSVFSPDQKQLLTGVAALAILLAGWHAVRFIRLYRCGTQPLRFAPAGLSILLLLFAGVCLAVVFAMSWLMAQPSRVLILPIVMVIGVLVCLSAAYYDALVNAWKSWRNRQGRFASPWVRFAILLGVALVAVLLGQNAGEAASISLHPQHVRGTVTRGRAGRSGNIQYTYTVDGHQYYGGGMGNFGRIYPVGSPVGVKYSSTHPACSTIEDSPLNPLLLQQLAFTVVVMIGFILLVGQKRKS